MNPIPFFSRLAATSAFAACSFVRLFATTTTPAAESTPTVAPYTNNVPAYVEVPVPVTRDYSPRYVDGDRGFSSGFNTYNTYATYRPYYATFYFPPVTPPLDERIPSSRGFRSSQPFGALPQLKPYVGEIFYAPLSAHLHGERLSKKRFSRLDAYQAARSALLAELQAALAATRDADPATRTRALTVLAGQQAPRLAALETEAESMRENFVNGTFFQDGANWHDNRSWSLGDDLRYESRVDEFKVYRASAFFTAGLSPAQRRLLREFAMELDEPLGAPTASLALDAPTPRFFFAPETARVDLPRNLSPELAARIESFTAARTALKSELRAVIYQKDRAFFRFTRTHALRELAAQQAPRFADLETQAEEIRVALAAYPRPSRSRISAIPDELSQRMIAYFREKQDLQRTLTDRLASLKSEFPQHWAGPVSLGPGSQEIELTASRRATSDEKKRVAASRPQLATFLAEQNRRFDALIAQKTKIEVDLPVVLNAQLKPDAGPTGMSSLVNQLAVQLSRLELFQRYRDYETAVLEPGLNPEQRRLLFSAALVQLDLPLPPGSRDP